MCIYACCMLRYMIYREYITNLCPFPWPGSHLDVLHAGTNSIAEGIPSDIATESSAWVTQKEIRAELCCCGFIQTALSWPFKVLQAFVKISFFLEVHHVCKDVLALKC